MTGKIIIVAGGVIIASVAILALTNKGLIPKDQQLNQRDLDVHKQHDKVHDKNNNPPLKESDAKAMLRPEKDYSEERYLALTKSITSRHSKRIEDAAAAASAASKTVQVGQGVGYLCMQLKDEAPQSLIDHYVALQTECLKAFSAVDAKCVEALANIMEAVGKSLEGAQQCHTYEFTKLETSKSRVITSAHSRTTVSNKGGSILGGLLARGKSSTKEVTFSSLKDDTKELTIDYVPHCKGKTIDPSTSELIMATKADMLISLFALQVNQWNRYPTVDSLFRK